MNILCVDAAPYQCLSITINNEFHLNNFYKLIKVP